MKRALLIAWAVIATIAAIFGWMHALGADKMRDRALQACEADE